MVPISQNGYTANDPTLMKVYTIGDGRQVQLLKGAPGWLLAHFADWFDKHVEDIDQGADDWGYDSRTIRGDAATLSNHASGTALDLNATRHPLGERGTFTAAQAAVIRAELARYDGAVRWGGDYATRPDEMHFEINAPLADVRRVVAKLKEDDMPYTDWPQADKDALTSDVAGAIRKELFETIDPATGKRVDEHLASLLRTLDANIEAIKSKIGA
jgi:hypothetical protein